MPSGLFSPNCLCSRFTVHQAIKRVFSSARPRIAVGVSGGIDSGVTAHILKEQRYDVIGIHMQNWELSADETLHSITPDSLSCFEKDEKDARQVCDLLNIPFHKVSFSKEYWNNVWETVIREYEKGFTPNPDILCNQYIKAEALPEYIEQKLGISHIATGHYARKIIHVDEQGQKKYKLLSGIDSTKDQAYFLSQITQSQLSRMEFPLGMLTKAKVRTIAKEIGLDFLVGKKESMGVCFVGKRRGGFHQFISQYIPPTPGVIRNQENVIGKHNGLHSYTIGERVRIGGLPEKYYCLGKIHTLNVIIAGPKEELVSPKAYLTNINWISGIVPSVLENGGSLEVDVQMKNLGKKIPSKIKLLRELTPHPDALELIESLSYKKNQIIEVEFESAANKIAAGQYMAFFVGDECLGSGKIYYDHLSKFS